MLGKYTKINAIVTAASTNWAYLWQQQAKESVPTHAQRLQALTPQAKATHKIRGISSGCVTRNGAKKADAAARVVRQHTNGGRGGALVVRKPCGRYLTRQHKHRPG